MDERLKKFPRWVQDLVREKDARIDSLQRELGAWEDRAGYEHVAYRRTGTNDMDRKAPAAEFRYKFGPGLHERIDVRHDGDCIYVNAGDSLAVVPEASNACRIYVRRLR